MTSSADIPAGCHVERLFATFEGELWNSPDPADIAPGAAELHEPVFVRVELTSARQEFSAIVFGTTFICDGQDPTEYASMLADQLTQRAIRIHKRRLSQLPHP